MSNHDNHHVISLQLKDSQLCDILIVPSEKNYGPRETRRFYLLMRNCARGAIHAVEVCKYPFIYWPLVITFLYDRYFFESQSSVIWPLRLWNSIFPRRILPDEENANVKNSPRLLCLYTNLRGSTIWNSHVLETRIGTVKRSFLFLWFSWNSVKEELSMKRSPFMKECIKERKHVDLYS